MVTKRTRRRAQRQVQASRPLYAWAEEKFLSGEYDRFILFCKEMSSSLEETNLVSQATFEHLVEEFEQKDAMEN